MLSAEASSLASLILERYRLVGRAIELEIELELARLHDSADCAGPAAPVVPDAAVAEELARLPYMIQTVSEQIVRSWADLDRVSPHER